MFDTQGTPEAIVSVGRRKLQFEEAVSTLTRFSLIRALHTTKKEPPVEKRLFEMHVLFS